MVIRSRWMDVFCITSSLRFAGCCPRSTYQDPLSLVELMLRDKSVIDYVLLLKEKPGFFSRRLQGLGIHL